MIKIKNNKSRKTKITSLVLSVGVLSSVVAPTVAIAAENKEVKETSKVNLEFTDVKGHWSEDYINDLKDRGLILGYPDSNEFRVDDSIKREEVSAIISRVIGRDGREIEHKFNDIEGRWSEDVIAHLASEGIIKGIETNSNELKFEPERDITRAEFAVIVSRVMDLMEFDDDLINSLAGIDVEFNDTDNHWANEYIERVASTGVIEGYEDNSFKPDETISRAEVSTMISRTLTIEALLSNANLDKQSIIDLYENYMKYLNSDSEHYIGESKEFTEDDFGESVVSMMVYLGRLHQAEDVEKLIGATHDIKDAMNYLNDKYGEDEIKEQLVVNLALGLTIGSILESYLEDFGIDIDDIKNPDKETDKENIEEEVKEEDEIDVSTPAAIGVILDKALEEETVLGVEFNEVDGMNVLMLSVKSTIDDTDLEALLNKYWIKMEEVFKPSTINVGTKLVEVDEEVSKLDVLLDDLREEKGVLEVDFNEVDGINVLMISVDYSLDDTQLEELRNSYWDRMEEIFEPSTINVGTKLVEVAYDISIY